MSERIHHVSAVCRFFFLFIHHIPPLDLLFITLFYFILSGNLFMMFLLKSMTKCELLFMNKKKRTCSQRVREHELLLARDSIGANTFRGALNYVNVKHKSVEFLLFLIILF